MNTQFYLETESLLGYFPEKKILGSEISGTYGKISARGTAANANTCQSLNKQTIHYV
jgi:hypothetical protein